MYRSDALIVVTLDAVTSIFAGFAIFSILGHLAHTLNTGVDKVAKSGDESLLQSAFFFSKNITTGQSSMTKAASNASNVHILYMVI